MNKRVLMHNRKRISFLLAFSGGFLDAYTFLFRGGVFANAQTGNMVLLAIKIAQGQFAEGLTYVIPILAFILGIFCSEYFSQREGKEKFRVWRHYIVLFEILVCFIIGFIPQSVPNIIINTAVSFIASLQVNSFKKVRDLPYSNAFCTGNLRSACQRLVAYLFNHDSREILKSITYLTIILCFIVGAAFSVYFTVILKSFSIMITMIPLFIVYCLLVYDYLIEKKRLL